MTRLYKSWALIVCLVSCGGNVTEAFSPKNTTDQIEIFHLSWGGSSPPNNHNCLLKGQADYNLKTQQGSQTYGCFSQDGNYTSIIYSGTTEAIPDAQINKLNNAVTSLEFETLLPSYVAQNSFVSDAVFLSVTFFTAGESKETVIEANPDVSPIVIKTFLDELEVTGLIKGSGYSK